MNAAAADVFSSQAVELSWREQAEQPPVTASCWFERQPVRHVVQKHFGGDEPWGRICDGPLVQRLDAVARSQPPTPADCREFVKALGRELAASCSRPLLCRFQETELPVFEDPSRPHPTQGAYRACEKILFVLPTGAAAFVRVSPSCVTDATTVVFLTAFFPRQGRGWVTPKRAATTTAAYYLRRWAQYRHRSGGRLHPEPDDAVSERDEVTGRATHRRWFRFVTPQTWGFRLQKDGQWAWQDPALPRF